MPPAMPLPTHDNSSEPTGPSAPLAGEGWIHDRLLRAKHQSAMEVRNQQLYRQCVAFLAMWRAEIARARRVR